MQKRTKENFKKILAHIRDNKDLGYIRSKDICELCDMEISTVRPYLHRMMELGYLTDKEHLWVWNINKERFDKKNPYKE